VSTAPAAKVETGAWLAWRQDVGGVARTALIELEAPGTEPKVTKATRLLLAAGPAEGGSLAIREVAPAPTRWSLSPCGAHALAAAKGVRVGPAGGVGAGGGLIEVSDPALRPPSEANAIHREFVVFTGQSARWLWVRHVTRSGPCPLGEGARVVTELAVDLVSGAVTPTGGPVPPRDDGALALRRTEAPAAVQAYWDGLVKLDEGREVEPDEAGLYGGVGWVAVPPPDVARVRDLIEAARDAPTPSGPTDWD
jgi:hypothetical protein